MMPRVRATVEPVARLDEVEPETADAPAADASSLLQLQQTAGNQAVVRMVRGAARTPSGRVLARKTAFETAVEKKDWAAAATELVKLTSVEIVAQLKPVPEADQDEIAKAASAADAPLVKRAISFARHRPADAAKHADEFSWKTDPGATHTGKVAGGTVEAKTGGKAKFGTREETETYTLGYKGTDAEKTRWLQFIWREIEVTRPDGKTDKVDQEITTTGGTYRLTVDPTKPSYNTDTASTTDPFYEAGGVNNRTDDSTTMLDMPAPALAIVKAQLAEPDAAKKPTKVVSRAHFTTYLVRDMEVLYKMNVDVEWVFTSDAVPPRTQTVSGAAANALDPLARKRLIAQFPNFDYLP
jgi:hypothetical protein